MSDQDQLKSSMISGANVHEADDLRFRSMADAAPMRILYYSSIQSIAVLIILNGLLINRLEIIVQ